MYHQAPTSAQETVTVAISHPVFDGPVHALHCNRQPTPPPLPTLRAIVVQISPTVPKALVSLYPRVLATLEGWFLTTLRLWLMDDSTTPVPSLSSSLKDYIGKIGGKKGAQAHG